MLFSLVRIIMQIFLRYLAFLIGVLLFSSPVFAAETYTAADALSLKRIGQVAVSPSGDEVAFTVIQMIDGKSGKQWEAINYLKNKNGKVEAFTQPKQLSFLPTWSPDGKTIAYLSGATLKLYNTQTKQTTEALRFDRGIAALKWSPNGKRIAFVAADKKVDSKTRLKNPDKDHENLRLYVINLQTKEKKLEALTSADYSISAVTVPWLDGGFDWSPDGKTMAFSYQPHAGTNEAVNAKLALLDVETHKVKNIPYTDNHTGSQPHYSFDGKWLAFRTNAPHSEIATALNNNSDLNAQICVLSTARLDTKCLANTFNENPMILGWKQNNTELYVIDTYKTKGQQIYSLNLNSNEPAKLVSQPNNGLLDVISINNSSSVFGFAYETTQQPAEPYISSADKFKLEQVTQLQKPNSKPLGQVKTIAWKSPDGTEIEGVLITPPNYDPHKKYPLLLAIHGGPEGVWAEHYVGGCESGGASTLIPCWGSLASQGFVVLQPNPRGSTGYGRKFRIANYADWGGHDYQDIMSGVDYLIKQGIAAPDHLAVSGWSYGGYMTSWIVTHDSRFKAAVDGAGPVDLTSFALTSDLTRNIEEYLGKYYWNNKLYSERSPIMYVNNIQTPLLIVHGDADDRVPFGQAQEMYTALRQLNKPVKFLVMPGQAHIPNDPAITIEAVQAITDWLKQAM